MTTPLEELRDLVHARWRDARTSGIPRLGLMAGAVPRYELDAVYEPMVNFVLLSKTCTHVRTVLFLPRTVLLTCSYLTGVRLSRLPPANADDSARRCRRTRHG